MGRAGRTSRRPPWRSSTASTTRLWCATRSRACAALRLWARSSSAARRSCATRPATTSSAAPYGLPLRRAGEGGAGGRPGAAAGAALDALLGDTAATIVVDLSDEPVLGYRERFPSSVSPWREARLRRSRLRVLAPPLQRLSTAPSLAVIGTGKRVGKTAVSGLRGPRPHAPLAPAGGLVVAMGRGGPASRSSCRAR